MESVNRKKGIKDIKELMGRIRKGLGLRWRRIRLEDYYYSAGDETKKHFSARCIDRVSLRVSVFTIVFLIFYFFIRDALISVLNGIAWTAMVHVLAKKRRRNRARRNKEKILKKEAIDRFLDLTKDKEPEEFFDLIQDLLSKDALFSKLKCTKDNEGRPLIITGYFQGTRIGIYAKDPKGNTMIDGGDLKDFVKYCRIIGLKTGLYITNSTFDYAARGYAAGLGGDFNLILADKETLYNAFIKQGSLFSMADLEKRIEQAALEQSYGARHNLKNVLALKRVKTYGILSVLIAMYSIKVPYTLYYIFVSIILLCLSVTALVKWEIERHRRDIEESIKLDKIMEIE